MTLDKAIEILTDILAHVEPGDPPEEHDAISLGSEALKAVRKMRVFPFPDEILHLPGETEE